MNCPVCGASLTCPFCGAPLVPAENAKITYNFDYVSSLAHFIATYVKIAMVASTADSYQWQPKPTQVPQPFHRAFEEGQLEV